MSSESLPPPGKTFHVAVVGAGVIGVLCALKLQKEGHTVTLIDRDAPASGCSFGNAGILARSSFMPLSNPSSIFQVPKWLFKADGPLKIKISYLPQLIPWLYKYIKAGFCADLEARGAALAQLTTHCVEDYLCLAKSAGCSNLVVATDYLQVYRTRKAMLNANHDMAVRRSLGFQIEELKQPAIASLEPGLSTDYQYAHLIKNHGYVQDPQALVLALFSEFCAQGGVFVKEQVVDIGGDQQQCQVITAKQSITSDKLVIATGAFSAKVLKAIKVKVPLEAERGYHITCPTPNVKVRRPVMDGDKKFFLTPMSMGYRFAGLVEFAGLETPLQDRNIKQLTKSAQAMLPDLNIDQATAWLGLRPTTSDSLPIISTAVDNKRIIYAFGHQHLGLTCAPMTAVVVADLVAERGSNIDISYFDVRRFD